MILTVITIIAFPLFGAWCYKKGREIERFEQDVKIHQMLEEFDEKWEKMKNECRESN